MKNIIKKILKEEVEDDGFDWIRDIKFSPGEFYEDRNICFGEQGYGCDVVVYDDEYLFIFDFDVLFDDLFDLGDDSSKYFFEGVVTNSPYYDDHNLDSDEFNYIYITETQYSGLQHIMDKLGIDINVKKLSNNNTLLEIGDHLRDSGYLDIEGLFYNLVDDVVNEIGYSVERNRWIGLRIDYENKLRTLDGIGLSVYRGLLEVTVPIELIHKKMGESNDLTSIIRSLLDPLVDYGWTDSYYDHWDTNGAEYQYIIDDFIKNVNEVIDDDNYLTNHGKYVDEINILGFRVSTHWRYRDKYILTKGNKSFVINDVDFINNKIKTSEYVDDRVIDSNTIEIGDIEGYVNTFFGV